jgi:hypothetical protein
MISIPATAALRLERFPTPSHAPHHGRFAETPLPVDASVRAPDASRPVGALRRVSSSDTAGRVVRPIASLSASWRAAGYPAPLALRLLRPVWSPTADNPETARGLDAV